MRAGAAPDAPEATPENPEAEADDEGVDVPIDLAGDDIEAPDLDDPLLVDPDIDIDVDAEAPAET